MAGNFVYDFQGWMEDVARRVELLERRRLGRGGGGGGISVKGSGPWSAISALGNPSEGDLWILTDATGAPASPYGPAAVGDSVVWDGAAWQNVGPVRGPAGPQGPAGEPGAAGAPGQPGPKGDPQFAYEGAVPPPDLPTGAFFLDTDCVPVTTGVQGPEGPRGPIGPAGPRGEKGDAGSGVTIAGSSSWSAISALPSPETGEMWILTDPTGAPASSSGPAAAGDGVVWEGSAWVNVGPIRGPAGPQGPKGDQGDPGPAGQGVTSTVRYLWAGTTTTADPGTGRIAVSGTGNQPRVIAISETDADGTARNIGLLNLADSIVVTEDADNPSQFSRYMLTADPVDHGAYWTMNAIRTDTLGPTQPPAVGTALRVQAYLTDVPPMTLGNLGDVDAPPDTPAGKVLGTTATGAWGPVDQSSGPSPATTNPVSVSGQSSSVGTSLDYARADHRHTIQFAAPVALGPAISAGTSTALARADHVHPVPALDALPDVEAPADTPAGRVLGTTATGQWGPVDTSLLVGPKGDPGEQGPPGASYCPNLLTPNQASGTDALGTTVGFDMLHGYNATVRSLVFAGAPVGSRVAAFTQRRAQDGYIAMADKVPVRAGAPYTFTVSVHWTAAPGEAFPTWTFFDSSGLAVGDIYRFGAAEQLPSQAWTVVGHTLQPSDIPPQATHMAVGVSLPVGMPEGTEVYLDRLGLWECAGGEWTMPPGPGPQGPPGDPGPKGDPQFAYEGAEPPADLPVGAFFLDTDCVVDAPVVPDAAPLRWLSDVSAPTDTPAGLFLGTTGMGQWGPLPLPVGNLLSADTASLEGGIGDWGPSAQQGAAVGTLEQSSGWSLHGTKSARITCKTTDLPSFAISTDIPVKAGGTYTFTASGFKDTVTAQSAGPWLALVYFAADGHVTASSNAYFRTDGQYDYEGSNWSTGAARALKTVVAPPGTAYARLYIYGEVGTPGAYFYLDCFGVWEGAGGDWSMPGSPIPNLGVRARRPNTDDRLVEVWDGGKWVPVLYDSGWRDIWSAAAPGAQKLEGARIRRTNSSVKLVLGLSTPAGHISGGVVLTLPVGFRPNQSLGGLYLPAGYDPSVPSLADTDGTIHVYKAGEGVGVRLLVDLPVDDAIPTSLPGTLITPAP
jgi:hypothetical protein